MLSPLAVISLLLSAGIFVIGLMLGYVFKVRNMKRGSADAEHDR